MVPLVAVMSILRRRRIDRDRLRRKVSHRTSGGWPGSAAMIDCNQAKQKRTLTRTAGWEAGAAAVAPAPLIQNKPARYGYSTSVFNFPVQRISSELGTLPVTSDGHNWREIASA